MRGDDGEPFDRWLRRRVGWLTLVAGVLLLVWAIVRPCPSDGCDGRSELVILLPALPLVLIGGVTLLGEWALQRRERMERGDDRSESRGG